MPNYNPDSSTAPERIRARLASLSPPAKVGPQPSAPQHWDAPASQPDRSPVELDWDASGSQQPQRSMFSEETPAMGHLTQKAPGFDNGMHSPAHPNEDLSDPARDAAFAAAAKRASVGERNSRVQAYNSPPSQSQSRPFGLN